MKYALLFHWTSCCQFPTTLCPLQYTSNLAFLPVTSIARTFVCGHSIPVRCDYGSDKDFGWSRLQRFQPDILRVKGCVQWCKTINNCVGVGEDGLVPRRAYRLLPATATYPRFIHKQQTPSGVYIFRIKRRQ